MEADTSEVSEVIKQFQSDDVYKQFLSEDFDAKAVACSAIQDLAIPERLSKLSAGITLLDKELHNQVAAHYEDLLAQATGIETLQDVLQSMFVSIQNLQITAERLQSKVIEPYNKTSNQTAMLARLQQTCDLIRRMGRIFHLTKRLKGQLQGGAKEITKAAQSLSEADYFLEGIDMDGIEIVQEDLAFLREAKKDVKLQAENMLERGIETQNQSLVGAALQVFFNLQLLEPQVLQVVQKAIERLQENTSSALDVANLTQQVFIPGSKGPGKASIPIAGNSAQFRAALWTNTERVTDNIYRAFSKIRHLEKVLAKKKDPVTHTHFMQELEKNGHENILKYFWESVTDMLSRELTKASNDSTFLKQAFESEYPKLLSLFNDLWKRLTNLECSQATRGEASSLSADSSAEYEQPWCLTSDNDFDPEDMLWTTLKPFENAYLTRSLSRLLDTVNVATSTSTRDTPTREDIDGILRVIASELKVASVDGKLCRTVAKNVVQTIHHLCARCEHLVAMDGADATQVIGPPTGAQQCNGAVVHLLHHFSVEMNNYLGGSNLSPDAVAAIRGSLQYVDGVVTNAIQPLLDSIADSIEAIILTMHNENFSQPATEKTATPDAPCSLYMRELQQFLSRCRNDYFALFPSCEIVIKRIQYLASRSIELFVRHASLVRPLGDGGKMRLAADFAQMEMALAPLCQHVGDLGRPYKLLRSFRPLLFQTPQHLAQSSLLGDAVPYSLVLHFLFAKAPAELRSPYETASWSRTRYSKWLDQHPSEKERLILIRA
ncbi:conserved oligomeric Golgi complex subunit 5-like isoform X2 [Ornithodoros turicata]|uniref:conserved oligomeric Golgi complex subunit 5-like isoform X2 n=1 Tax=Ornithodoros turicata TaxID=34597 RepID=UPI0031396ED6